MASDEADIATGASLTFAAAAIVAAREILDFTPPEASVEIEDVSHQGSLTALKKIAKNLKDYGQLELVLHHWQDYDYFSEIGATGPVTLTMPSGATLAFYGILQSYSPQAATLNNKMTANAVIVLTGDTAATPSETVVITPAA